MLIKVCGNKYQANLAEVDKLNIDFLGFIFHESSPRNVIEPLEYSPKTPKIGVFVNKSTDFILEKVKEFKLEGVQLHGQESVEQCLELKTQELIVFKVFHLDQEFDFSQMVSYRSVVDYFLFDTKAEQAGGTGKKFNWEILKQYPFHKPFFLSGGISPKDVAEIKALDLPALSGLDLNSGFEVKPAIKKTKDLKSFIKEFKTVSFKVDERGYYGKFGGAYIPEMLYGNVEELRLNYQRIMDEPSFQKEFKDLLKEYVGRPTPLYFSDKLSKKYKAKVFLKREDLNHTGAHKVNNTIGQALVAKAMGKKEIIAETGAGQHGVATATVCALLGLGCKVFMGEKDIVRQAPNVSRMKMLGAEVIPATSGSKTLKDATNEAIRFWINNPDSYYLIGSVVGPHPYPDMVAKFQSIISEEIISQLKEKGGQSYPNYVIACVGGGSNAAGAYYHFLDDDRVNIIAVEAAGLGVDSGETAATIQKGTEGVIHGSYTLLMQDSEGQITEPYSISAGLDYPGIGPLHAHLFDTKRAEFLAVTDAQALEAAYALTRMDGIIPALESSHALAALDQLTFRPSDVVIVNLSGRGDKDLATYINNLKD